MKSSTQPIELTTKLTSSSTQIRKLINQQKDPRSQDREPTILQIELANKPKGVDSKNKFNKSRQRINYSKKEAINS